jgi:hypothetical protein
MISVLGLAMALPGCGDDDGGTTTTSSGGTGGSGGDGGDGATGGSGGTGVGGEGGAGGSGGSVTQLPCDGATCDLTLSGTGFGVHDGKTLYWGIVPQGAMGLDYDASVSIEGGAFSSTGTGVLAKGSSYFVHYFVDKNENQTCEATPEDDVWRIPLSNVQTHIELDVLFASAMSNLGCGGFP